MKSILKPTASISPLLRNSPLIKSRKMSPKKPMPDKLQNNLLYDVGASDNSYSSAGSNRSPSSYEGSPASIVSEHRLDSPSQHRTRTAVRSEEEQQAAAKERERQDLLAHREARRKSLGEDMNG